jgi:hypothetical protein
MRLKLPITIMAISSALVGCQAVELKGPVALDGLRPANEACDVLASTTFTTLNAVDAPGCPAHEIGMPLRPGMVLRLATPTWGPAIGPEVLKSDQSGSDDQGNPLPALEIPLAAGARAPQIAALLRLPIRMLGPSGRLTDEEVTVLGAFLSLQRNKVFGAKSDVGDEAANTSKAWRAMLSSDVARAALWNAWVDAASLRRILPTSDISPDHRSLALVVNPATFCAHTQSAGATQAQPTLTDGELALLKAGLFGKDCTKITWNVEAFALRTDEIRSDPLAALAAQRGALNDGFFLDAAVSNPASVVSAELDAVSMGREGAEQRWSLAEWEESGVCGAGRQIEAFRVPGLVAAFSVVGRVAAPKLVTFKVEEIVSRQGVARRIVPIGGRRIRFSTAVAAEDLQRLRPVDVDDLAWTSPWGGRAPDPCRP